ncbi:unnamed protein product, partial [marine sediment metagenome]
WAIRNELRRRYKWYSLKYSQGKEGGDFTEARPGELREAVYETILSIDELEQAKNPVQIQDIALNPEQKFEFFELKEAICEAMTYLSYKERIVLELRFYKNKKVREIADELDVTSSRITKIIQLSLDKIKAHLIEKEII